MIFATTLQNELPTIIFWGIVAIPVALVLYFLFANVFFKGRKNKRIVRDFERKYNYIHNVLVNQDSAYIKRLETIASANLLFAETYTEYNDRYATLRDETDASARHAIEDLKASLNQKNKVFKDSFLRNRPILLNFERLVNELNKELTKLVKPEEDARQASLNEKEELRRIMAIYRAHQSELVIVEDSFEKIFSNIETLFIDYEEDVSRADYEEAKKKLVLIDKILRELKSKLDVLPSLCVKTTKIVPEKITELERTYQDLVKQSFPLHNLMVKSGIEEMRTSLGNIEHRIKLFEVKGLDELLDKMVDRIDHYFIAFKREKAERVVYENEFDGAYQGVNALEKKFIKLANTIPTIKEVYMLTPERENQIETIKNSINQVSMIKRTLDTFIHSSTHQPFSVLVEKMRALQNEAAIVTQSMDEFQHYLESLKLDAENAFLLIHTFFYKLKMAEKNLRELNIPAFSEPLAIRLDQCYSTLETIDSTLHVKPIDVQRINSLVEDLNLNGESLLSDIDNQYNMSILAENAIVYANRERPNFKEVQNLIKQSETMFEEGYFEKAYIEAGNVLKKYRSR